jgi:hypothetical protein
MFNIDQFITQLNDLEIVADKEKLFRESRNELKYAIADLYNSDKSEYERVVDDISHAFKGSKNSKVTVIRKALQNMVSEVGAEKLNKKVKGFSSADVKTLSATKQGEVQFTPANLKEVLLHANNVKFVWDRFTNQAYFTEMMWEPRTDPFEYKKYKSVAKYDRYEDNNNLIELKVALNQLFTTEKSFPNLDEVVGNVAKFNEIDFATDWLQSYNDWDGIDRMNNPETCWATTILKCEASNWAATFSRVLPLCLIYRIMQPGYHIRYYFAIEGEQNIGKSEFCRTIVPEKWSTIGSLQEKDEEKLGLQFNGHLVVELSEKGGMDRVTQEMQKRFLTDQYYKYRIIYEKYPGRYPRRNIFVVTTNDSYFLNDPTGNSRCVPIKSLRKTNEFIDLKMLEAIWPQVLAQALFMYNNKSSPYLTDEELETQKAITSKLDIVDDSIEYEMIEAYMNDRIGDTTRLETAKEEGVTMEHIYDFVANYQNIPRGQVMKHRTLLRRALKKYGFVSSNDQSKYFKDIERTARYYVWPSK